MNENILRIIVLLFFIGVFRSNPIILITLTIQPTQISPPPPSLDYLITSLSDPAALKLMSSPFTLCVKAPKLIKSTPA